MAMYIIYNLDGSIRYVNLTEFINQGNDGVNKILVGLHDPDHLGQQTNQITSVTWTLPSGETVGPVVSSQRSWTFINGIPYYVNTITLSEVVTQYPGTLKGSMVMEDLNTNVLYTYPIKLTINETTFVPSDEINITTVQYQNLLTYIATNQTKNGTKLYRHFLNSIGGRSFCLITNQKASLVGVLASNYTAGNLRIIAVEDNYYYGVGGFVQNTPLNIKVTLRTTDFNPSTPTFVTIDVATTTTSYVATDTVTEL